MLILKLELKLFKAGISFQIRTNPASKRQGYKWYNIIRPFFYTGMTPCVGLDILFGRVLGIIDLPYTILSKTDRDKLRSPFST